ncbi:hypothetical protein OOK58_57920 [Streptomyces sp. NBC_01728]|uniref:hypothetical protein n=1 Tax=unclassified Streptomyces TaxID=2593676 RepID=UPI002253CA6F|nr:MULTISPECIES: hypothetical protein [unclassified Streptomyces]MCX4462532.1 hypothetical protein [Streptomyces sp. NBC_01719]MCX4500639.1 hypothetical protein [Streptomyces sp. NBC_01728]
MQPACLPGREAAVKRAQWGMFKGYLRERGKLVDTLDVLVAYGVRAKLARLGPGVASAARAGPDQR